MENKCKCNKCGFEMDERSYIDGKGLCFACLMNKSARELSTGDKETYYSEDDVLLEDATKCPNCGSYAVNEIKLWAVGLAIFMTASILLFIPFLWILIPILIIFGILLIILSPFAKEYICKCKSCKYQWKKKK